MNKNIRILVTDDHPVIRRGLSTLINTAQDMEVVGEAENGAVALELIPSLKPDIAVLDINMPVLDGIETAKLINIQFPKVKVIFLSMHKSSEILDALKELNVMGYILKDRAVLEIIDCLNSAAKGEIFTSPVIKEILDKPANIKFSKTGTSSLISLLTATELRVLRSIGDSKTNREIAKELFISVRKVENHRFNICSKLNLKGNYSLLRFAIDNNNSILNAQKTT